MNRPKAKAVPPRRRAPRRKPKTMSHRATARRPSPPPIGSKWHDGIYAGIARGRDGGHDYHLIVLAETDSRLTWDEAMQQGLLPYRKEQALCFANVPELFKPEAYWSCEQHASYSVFAWGQYFGNGGQYYWTKNVKFRARLVRRLPI